MVKNPPALQETWVRSLVGKIPREGIGNLFQHSCLENSMDRGAWRAQSMGSQRVEHNLVTKQQQTTTPAEVPTSPLLTISLKTEYVCTFRCVALRKLFSHNSGVCMVHGLQLAGQSSHGKNAGQQQFRALPAPRLCPLLGSRTGPTLPG